MIKNERNIKHMKKINKGTFTSLVLVLSLLLSLAAPLFAVSAAPLAELKENLDNDGDGKINYFAIGSAAAAGAGVKESEAYPSLVKAALSATGKTVELSSFALDGMRAEELRYLLDKSYEPDSYTEKNFLGANGAFAAAGGVEALRSSLVTDIANAEVITVDLGIDSYLGYALSYIFENEYEADFNRFSDSLRGNTEEIKGRFEDVLNGYIKDADDAAVVGPLLQRAIDGLAYALVGFAESFDVILTHIYSLNPSATVSIVNVRNPLQGLTATVAGVDFPVPLTEVYGVLVDLANIYIGSLSEYSESYYFAYAGEMGQPESFINDSAAASANLAYYAGESASAQAALSELVKLGIGYSNLDITAAAAAPVSAAKTLDSRIKTILNDAKSPAYNLKASAEYREITSSDAMMTLLAVAVRRDFARLTTLPTVDGHREIANAIVSSIENATMGAKVVEKDMNEVYGFLFKYLGFTRQTLLDMEYAFNPYYTCDADSYYVAFGDGSALSRNSYVEKLAEKLGLNGTTVANRRYKKHAKEEFTPEYVLNNIGDYRADILAADLITLSFNNVATTSYMMDQLKAALGVSGSVKDNDWSAILGPDTAELVDEVVDMLKTEIEKGGFGAMGDALVVAIESFAYAYASRLVSYPALIETIHSINPNALVLIVGTYNDMKNMTVEIGDMVLPIGNYTQYLIDIANLETLALSVLSERTAYIAAPDVEIKSTTKNVVIDPNNLTKTISAVASFISDISRGNLNPSDNGHRYVANTVLSSITKIDPHKCVYDNDCDNRCDICKEKRTVKGHVYDAVCDNECNVCGSRRIAELHVFSGVCDDTCGTCGLTREVPDHTFGAPCDTECNVCGTTREVGLEHSFGGWTVGESEKSRTCSACGTVETLPLDGSEGSPVLVIVIVCVAVLALGAGGFAAFWFGVKKKTLADLFGKTK